MMNFKSNKGITLVVLIITIIVLLILAGMTINTGIVSLDNTKKSNEKSELLIIQHAIYERYVNYLQTNNEGLLAGERDGNYYVISNDGKLPSQDIDYYMDGDELYYFDNNEKIVLKGYGKAIRNQNIDINNKITNNSDVTINYFLVLGITGEGVENYKFNVQYETGYVKKVGSSLELKGYNINEVGEKTSNEISITN